MRLFLLVLIVSFAHLTAYSQAQCSAAEYRQELINKAPGFSTRLAAIESFTKKILAHGINSTDTSTSFSVPEIITIPVVVHVVYNSGSQNISDAQIKSQIEVLNQDYRRLNPDSVNTPEVFRPVAADCGINFKLANVDPSGNPSSGIVRKHTNIQSFGLNDDVKSSATGGDDPWDAEEYLNIWVTSLSSGVLGYSSIPGAARDKDGVVIHYAVFGTTGSLQAPFNKGRTTTHEIGHWLNLIHTWGDASCGDDLVADTPPQQGPTRGCPDGIKVTCGNGPNGDMYMNYMDFTNDACLNIFTKGQRDRIRSLFVPGGFRNGILNTPASRALAQQPLLLPGTETIEAGIRVYPNPASTSIYIQTPGASSGSISIQVYNGLGQQVMSLKMNQHLQQLDISPLRSGIYYVHCDDGKSRTISKLVKL